MQQNNSSRVAIIRGSIVDQDVDGIVNAATSALLGEGCGMEGAIHRAAGPALRDECLSLGGCPPGEARITRGYDLLARHVIHTVGPVYVDGNEGEPEILESCYRSSLALAEAHGLVTLAFPAISTAALCFPRREAADIALKTVHDWLDAHALPARVTFVLFNAEEEQIYREVFASRFRGATRTQ